MLTISSLVPGQVYTNKEIAEAFKCSSQGGMRRSHKTNTLVIFALHNKSIYKDEWDGDELHYTGMGQKGNQSIKRSQNKTLAESNTNGVTVHLFESYNNKENIYDGIVELSGKPYYADEADINYNQRKVVKFPIKLVSGQKVDPTPDMLKKCKEAKEKKISKISDEKLKELAKKSGSKKPKQKSSPTTTYERDELVIANAKRRANGVCDLCEKEAPFKNKKGAPYLETHHVIKLADNGPDTIYNTVALCPNCHRKMHSLNLKVDNQKLINKIGEYIKADVDQDIIDDYKELFDL